MARHALDGGGEILRRYVQSLGIVTHLALSAADVRREQIHQLLDDIGRAVGVSVGSVALGVRLEDVVHHRQAGIEKINDHLDDAKKFNPKFLLDSQGNPRIEISPYNRALVLPMINPA